MSIIPSFPLPVTGSRFRVCYQILGDEKTARARAEDICIEETIEYPADLVPEGGIREHVFGRIESFESTGPERYEAVISYADEISGYELPQLINVIFGNISMKPALRVMELDLSEKLLEHFKGPRFGISGLRDLVGVHDRPLLFTATKPIGLSAQQLADMAYQLALGGLDIIKDDHGLADQPFAPFKERIARTAEAVAKANAKTGLHTLYAPNVTGPFETMLERIHFAKAAGATGLMLLPGYCGLDFVRRVAEDDEIGLPIVVHPAFMGSFVLSPDFGVSHFVLHGQFMRLAGADITVMPNYIGRFSYSREECNSIARGCHVPMREIKSIFPGPGGGISPESFADMLEVYGRDVVYLISGNLHRQSPDLTQNVLRFREMLEKM
ncbi:MAG: ribulose 1,5-bisphosphate carboxylase large subunit [Anaerolinea sp.]|nr:ribulose 1,5-bisphosphate carboxylase large subunit [Anaerolinea sp.]